LEGALYCIDCAGVNPECGWSADFGYYDCGTDGSADPAGTNPLNCFTCDPACGPDEVCTPDGCEVCVPDCAGKMCGSNGCGGQCGECGGICLDGICHEGPGCEDAGEIGCGGCACEECVCEMDDWCCANAWDGQCVSECIADCGGCFVPANCGDGKCLPEEFENCQNCAADCGCVEPDVCFELACCTPACDGKVCGDNGCGGDCGTCDPGFQCTEQGLCEELPSCEMLEEITCDDIKEGDTTGHENLLEEYYCTGFPEAGPEVGYQLTAAVDDTVLVSIEYDMDAIDLDLVVTQGACTIDACMDGGENELLFDAVAGETYFFVVDGFFPEDAGAYTISVKCKSTCVPQCDGKECGPDGCFGECGECEAGICDADGKCNDGLGCVVTETPGCPGCPCEECVCEMDTFCCGTSWDGICADECMNDCGGCVELVNCGNGECVAEEFENCGTCPADCACDEGEACFKGACCSPACDDKACGDDGCGGSCGECGAGTICTPEGTCVEGMACLGPNEPSDPDCGDISEAGCCDEYGRVVYCLEGALYCIDCAGLNPECGWSPDNNWYDCGTDGSGDPSGANPLSCVSCDPPCEPGFKCVEGACVECIPDCKGKFCGSDGCGGSCGECPEGAVCQEGDCLSKAGCEATPGVTGCGGCACEACVCDMDPYCCETEWDDYCVGECVNDCGGCPPVEVQAVCGDKYCNGDEDCSTCADDCACADGKVCQEGACVACQPVCDGKECGDDGCGGQCGECTAPETCNDQGLCECVAACDGTTCGDDGCGSKCTCAQGTECNAEEKCEEKCVPACDGTTCGDDGCGGKCTCAEGTQCSEDGLCVGAPIGDVVSDAADEDVDDEKPAPKKKDSGCASGNGGTLPALFLFAIAMAILGYRRVGEKA